MTTKVTINRLATGVPGLDEVLGGGLPEFSFNLIAGPPGCGKTTLAHQIMFALATPERPALYFTVLGEPPLKMLRYQQQFDFFDSESINRSIRFVNLADETPGGRPRPGAAPHRRRGRGARARRWSSSTPSAPSCSPSQADGNSQHNLQQFVQQLGMLMTSWQATTFLIGEYFTETDANPVFTVADGLIWLRQSVQRNSMVRKMEIMKMRGQPTLPGLHTFRIGSAGIEVFAPAGHAGRPAEAAAAPLRRARLLMGVPRLDEMLGGGVPRGYSVLVAGPSGSGKSILAAAFLAEGARCGETGVIAAFEQQPQPLAQPRARRPDRERPRRAGRQPRARPVDRRDRAAAACARSGASNATRVVIDSLSGFELALAPTFREDFRESLSRLVAALAGTGVTVLMTSELEDRYTDLRFSPYGTAFLTDAIIVQRYIEVDSRLLRVMAVVKVRASAHSDELRLFSIDDDGIQVGEMLDRPGRAARRPADAKARRRSGRRSRLAALKVVDSPAPGLTKTLARNEAGVWKGRSGALPRCRREPRRHMRC